MENRPNKFYLQNISPFGSSNYGLSGNWFIESGNDPSDSDIYAPAKNETLHSKPINTNSNNNNNDVVVMHTIRTNKPAVKLDSVSLFT